MNYTNSDRDSTREARTLEFVSKSLVIQEPKLNILGEGELIIPVMLISLTNSRTFLSYSSAFVDGIRTFSLPRIRTRWSDYSCGRTVINPFLGLPATISSPNAQERFDKEIGRLLCIVSFPSPLAYGRSTGSLYSEATVLLQKQRPRRVYQVLHCCCTARALIDSE